MRGIGFGKRFVAVGLACLGQQDQWRCIGGLEAEGQVEQDERVYVEFGQAGDIEHNPNNHDNRLPNKKGWRSKETGKSLSL